MRRCQISHLPLITRETLTCIISPSFTNVSPHFGRVLPRHPGDARLLNTQTYRHLRDLRANVNTNKDQERAQQHQERMRQHRAYLFQQRQAEERQRQTQGDVELPRNIGSLNMTTDQPAPRQRRRQESRAGSEEAPASIQAGIARGQRGSRRVDVWMENVPFRPRAQPIR